MFYGSKAAEGCSAFQHRSCCTLCLRWCAVRTPTMFIGLGLYSRIGDLFLHQSALPVRSPCNSTNTEVAQLSNDAGGGCRSVIPDGEQPKTALWLWVRQMTWYLYTRGVRGRMKAKQRWFKVTVSWVVSLFLASCSWRPLHWRIRHSPWRLDSFTVSIRGDNRGESVLRKFASVNRRTPQWHVAN